MKSKEKKTTLILDAPDGEKKVVSKFDPPNHALFPAKPKTRKRGRK